jgi:hypothetical protein
MLCTVVQGFAEHLEVACKTDGSNPVRVRSAY